MDFVKNSFIGKFLELSGQTQVQNHIMKLFEQLGEAIPQLGLNITYYINNRYYVWFTESPNFLGISAPTTLVSMVFSLGSILMGLFNGVKAAMHVKQRRALMSGAATWNEEKVKKFVKYGGDLDETGREESGRHPSGIIGCPPLV